jgi:tryptophan halogenase
MKIRDRAKTGLDGGGTAAQMSQRLFNHVEHYPQHSGDHLRKNRGQNTDLANIREICVLTPISALGGGTAGYFTAIAIKECLGLDVTLIESPDIPIIGVGEATTPPIIAFLHQQLGISPTELYRHVLPTWKLGIRFDWGQPGPYHFPYPFDSGQWLAESVHYEGTLHYATVNAALMHRQRSPVLRFPDGRCTYLPTPYAYHLNNKPFVEFLQAHARAQGVKQVLATIADVRVVDGRVERLMTDDQRCFQFDLIVDCTGFRSHLLEQALGSPFIDYSSTLLTDSAVVCWAPHDGHIKPYTTAETMHCGWC